MTGVSAAQGRADAGKGAGPWQNEDQAPEEGGSSIQEGSAVMDAESSVNSLLGPTLGQLPSENMNMNTNNRDSNFIITIIMIAISVLTITM